MAKMQSESMNRISETYLIEGVDPRLVFGQNDIYLLDCRQG